MILFFSQIISASEAVIMCDINEFTKEFQDLLRNQTHDANPVLSKVREWDPASRQWVEKDITYRDSIKKSKLLIQQLNAENRSSKEAMKNLAHQYRLRATHNLSKGNIVEASKDFKDASNTMSEVVKGKKITSDTDIFSEKELSDALEAFTNAGDINRVVDMVDPSAAIQTARDIAGFKPNISEITDKNLLFSIYMRAYNVARTQGALADKAFRAFGYKTNETTQWSADIAQYKKKLEILAGQLR